MVRSLIFSISFHALIIVLTILSLPFMLRQPIDLPPIVSVELIQISDKTNIPYAPKARKVIEKVKKDEKRVVSEHATPAAKALSILLYLPYLIIVTIFIGGLPLAIDTTAGEKERGSLEPLLVQPIDRSVLLYGKMAAISLFSGLSLILLLVILNFLIPFIPFSDLGLDLEIDAMQYLIMFVICIPIILFSSALLTVVGSFTKTFKEAQTYLSLMIVLPTLPIIIAQLMNAETSLLIMPIPSLAQSTLITDIIEQGELNWLHAMISIISTTFYGWLLARLAIYLYSREQIVN